MRTLGSVFDSTEKKPLSWHSGATSFLTFLLGAALIRGQPQPGCLIFLFATKITVIKKYKRIKGIAFRLQSQFPDLLFKKNYLFYLFIFGRIGSSLLRLGFL